MIPCLSCISKEHRIGKYKQMCNQKIVYHSFQSITVGQTNGAQLFALEFLFLLYVRKEIRVVEGRR